MSGGGRLAWRRFAGLAIALLVTAVVTLGVLATPGRGDDDDAEGVVHAPMRVTVKNGVTVLTLSAADQHNDGIMTGKPVAAPAQTETEGYGSVLDAAGLTELSNRYLVAESAVQTAEAKLAVSRAAYQRAKILHGDRQNISTAELQAAAGAFAVDKAELAAAHSRLATVAASARQDWGNVIGGALADHAPLVADLVERQAYLVKVTLPPGISIAAPATATTRIDGGPEIRLDFVSPATSIDPRLQGVSYFYRAAAGDGMLPGLRLDVSLKTRPAERGVIVPEGAVVWLQGRAWTYLRTGPTRFERRGIATDRPGLGGGYIVTGLPPDAEIVVRGTQMLLSEEFRSQAPIED